MGTQRNHYPPWSPRFWNGLRLSHLWRLLNEHRWRISPIKYPMTVLVNGCGVFNSLLAGVQRLCLDRALLETELLAPPVFIVGHWRSGTTLLHELMSLDNQVTSPGNFEAFVPHHALVSRFFLKPLVNVLLPRKRPMDDMGLAANSPQEDDFALISMGAATPYRDIAFPNDRMRQALSYDFDELSTDQQQGIHKSLDYLYRLLTKLYGKRLILKSPPHTSRIGYLADWFPGAKFIHISRNPIKLVPSTLKLWSALDETQGFQWPRYSPEAMADFVHRAQSQLYGGYFRQRERLSTNSLAEIKFEDLLQDPESTLERTYQQLDLPGWDRVRDLVKAYFAERAHVRPQTEPDLRWLPAIRQHWSHYATEFGYDLI